MNAQVDSALILGAEVNVMGTVSSQIHHFAPVSAAECVLVRRGSVEAFRWLNVLAGLLRIDIVLVVPHNVKPSA